MTYLDIGASQSFLSFIKKMINSFMYYLWVNFNLEDIKYFLREYLKSPYLIDWHNVFLFN